MNLNSTVQEDLLNIEELQTPFTYGRFWPRFWALLLDALILSVLTPLTVYNKTGWKSSILFIVISCIQLAYKPFFEYKYGATPGKMALKLRVVNYEYGTASLNEILLRNSYQIAGSLISVAIGLYNLYQPESFDLRSFQDITLRSGVAIFVPIFMGIIYLVDLGFLLNSADSRSLHDRIGKTYVIKG